MKNLRLRVNSKSKAAILSQIFLRGTSCARVIGILYNQIRFRGREPSSFQTDVLFQILQNTYNPYVVLCGTNGPTSNTRMVVYREVMDS